jgi:hypothetical protein
MSLAHRILSFGMENDDTSLAATACYLTVPVLGSVAILGYLVARDLACPSGRTGIAGAFITMLGALGGYGGSTRMWIRRGGLRRGVRDVPYGKAGFLLILLGTFVWALGDALVHWLEGGGQRC